MKITVEATPEEVAALVLKLQERHKDAPIRVLIDGEEIIPAPDSHD